MNAVLPALRRSLEESAERWAALAVAAVSVAVYAATLLPGVGFWDTAELQTVPSVMGTLHPTGYPVYTFVAKIVSLIPVGSVAFRANLFSAVCVSGALSIGVLVMARLGVRPVIAAAAALAVGFTPTMWSTAIRAEVHTLHLLLLALVLHRLLAWLDRRTPRDLYLTAFLAGLSMGNHMLTATVVPFVALAVLVRPSLPEHRLRFAQLLTAAACFALPLLSYLYLPLRAAQGGTLVNPALDDPALFIRHLTGRQFRSDMRFLPPAGIANLAAALPSWVAGASAAATPLLPASAALGLAVLLRRQRVFAITLAGIAVAAVFVYASYRAAYLERYLLAAWFSLAIAAGVGGDAAVSWLARHRAAGASLRLAPPARTLAPALLALPLAVPLALASMHWAGVDQSANRHAPDFTARVFGLLPRNAALLTYWDSANAVWYAQFVERQRPDLLVLTSSGIAERWSSLREGVDDLAESRPIYLLEMHPRLRDQLVGVADVVRIAQLEVAYGRNDPRHDRWLYRLVPYGAAADRASGYREPMGSNGRLVRD